jgi:proteasome assembly chaperone 3
VPLDIAATDNSMASNSSLDRDDDDPASDLLPMHHLTATTILGGTMPELDILGQTLATQIASAIKTRDERERRMVVLGMGLDKSMIAREEFSELVGLVLEVI